MFTFKSKKVFEKLNKMDRKQAYTIGSIVVVLVIALIMLVTAATSGEDDSFEGMNAKGYDLATLPFATDEAEKYLLANAYPDMQENSSSFLYTPAQKEQRQEEDAQNEEEEEGEDTEEYDDYASNSGSDADDEYDSGSSRGYSGYGGGYGGGRSGRGRTEIGTLTSAGMASAGGGGLNATYGPSGDFRQFKGREDRGNEKPVQLKTENAKQALAQFRSGSYAAARMNENKMRNMGKALFGGDIKGSDAFTKDGVDLSKLANGGFTLDTSAPSTTTDLNNLDKKVADATKKAEDKKNNEQKKELDFWEKLLQQAVGKLTDSLLNAAGNWIEGWAAGLQAKHDAKVLEGEHLASLSWNNLPPADQNYVKDQYKKDNPDITDGEIIAQWENNLGSKQSAKMMRGASSARSKGQEAYSEEYEVTMGRADERHKQEAARQRAEEERQAREAESSKSNPCPDGQKKEEKKDGTYKCVDK